MIYDKLSNLDRYRGASKNLDTAIDFLQRTDLSTLAMGRVEIQGDDVYANHFSYPTAPYSESCLFEDHTKYLDLHVILSGDERFAVTPKEELTFAEDRSHEDAIMYRGAPGESLALCPGLFLLVYPGEAHLPKLLGKAQTEVNKLVVKIAL